MFPWFSEVFRVFLLRFYLQFPLKSTWVSEYCSVASFNRFLWFFAVFCGFSGHKTPKDFTAQLLMDANAQDEEHLTPLHLASYNGAIEIARELLDGGAHANSKSIHGRTPLHTVAEGGDYYSRNNGVLVTQLLLERGAEVNVADVEGQTPLHLASYFGKAWMVQELLDVGADSDAKNAQGQTPFDLALQNPQLASDVVIATLCNFTMNTYSSFHYEELGKRT